MIRAGTRGLGSYLPGWGRSCPLEDIISSDEALAAAWREDGHADADKVQVTLGSADAKALHWDSLCDSACDLFCAIDWSGVSVWTGPL